MFKRSQVIAHFSRSADRYTWPPPDRNDFCVRSFETADSALRVLDLGCGTGERLEALSRYYPALHMFGLDLTAAMLAKAGGRNIPGKRFVLADCLNTPFRSGCFDVVILGDVLHHLIAANRPDSCLLRRSAWKEVRRITRAGGMILLRESCVSSRWRVYLLFWISRFLADWRISIPFLNAHRDLVVNFFTVSELEAFIGKTNLQVEAMQVTPIHGIANWLSGLGSFVRDSWYRLRVPKQVD